MKTVLKHGTTWYEKHKYLICPKCQCEFIYEPYNDIQWIYDEDIDSGSVGNRYVSCPECGHCIENFKELQDNK